MTLLATTPLARGRRRVARPRPATVRSSVFPAGVLVLLGAAGICWLVAALGTRIDGMNDLGLISVLPVALIAALVLVAVSFILQLRADASERLLMTHIVVIVVMVAALPAVVEVYPRNPTAWLHMGFVERLARTGDVVPGYDARFSWPGWFALSAFVTRAAGITDQLALVRWSPLFLDLAYLLPLRSIIWWAVPDRRRRFVALAIVVAANWVGQDYYSPQGFALLTYLVVLALVLRDLPSAWAREPLRHAPTPRRALGRRLALGVRETTLAPVPRAGESSVRRSAAPRLALVLVLLCVALVPSHQLTPFALAATLGMLAWWGHRRVGALALLAGVLAVGWLSFGAVDYWRGHLETLTGGVGQVGSSLQAGVGDRVGGDSAHLVVIAGRSGTALLVAALALVGVFRTRLRANRARICVIAVLGPISLLGLQAYGGEGVLRAYLFALPFLAVLASLALPRPVGWGVLPVGLLIVALVVSSLLTRYGNERFEQIRPEDVAAADWVYGHVPAGATLVALGENLPWRFTEVERYHYLQAGADFPGDEASVVANLGQCVNCWVIVSAGNIAYGEVVLGHPPGWTDALVQDLVATDRYAVAFRSGAAVVVAPLSPAAPVGAP